VIPVLNEGESLEAVVRALLDQDYPADKFEVLVVDGGSADRTLAVASGLSSAHSNVKVLSNPARLSSAGRNVGARAARGDVVLFVDGHCEVPDRFLLSSLDLLFRRTGADVMCRPQPLAIAGQSATQQAIALARASWLGHNPVSLIFAEDEEGFVDPESSGAAYTRRVFDRIGFFDESFDACEDVDFNLRARQSGLKAFTSPRLTIRYRPRESLGSLFRQMMRYGAGRARLFAKHPRRGLAGAALLGGPSLVVAALAAGSAFWADARYLLLWLVLAYAVVVAATSAALSFGRGIGLLPRLFAAFPAIHLGLAAGFWRRLFERPRGTRQEKPEGDDPR
jgi:GT2 family glycosyltransferase